MPTNASLQVNIRARDNTSAAFRRISRTVTNLGRTVRNAFGGITKNLVGVQNQFAAFLVAAGGFQALVRAPADFSRSMQLVGTLSDDARANLDQLTESVRQLSVESGIGTDRLASSLFDLISGGIAQQEAIGVLRTTVKLAVAGQSDITDAATGLIVTANSFGAKTSDEIEDIAKSLNAAAIVGRTTTAALSQNIGKIGASFDAAGIDIDTMNAALALVTRSAGNTEEATTELAGVLAAFSKPSTDMLKGLELMGVEFSETMLSGRNLGEFIAELRDVTAEAGIKFSDVFANLRGFRGALKLSANDGQEFNDVLEDQIENLTKLDKNFEAMDGTLAQTLDKVRTMAEVLAQEFASTAFDGLNDALKDGAANIDRLRIQAKIFGHEARLSIEDMKPIMTIVSESIMFLVDSVRVAMQAIKSIFLQAGEAFGAFMDTLKSTPFLNKLFTSDLDRYNESLADNVERRKQLQKELDRINKDIAQGGKKPTTVSFQGDTWTVGKAVSVADLEKERAELEAKLRVVQVERDNLFNDSVKLLEQGAKPGLTLDDPFTAPLNVEFQLDLREAQRKLALDLNRSESDQLYAEIGGRLQDRMLNLADAFKGTDTSEIARITREIEKLKEQMRGMDVPPEVIEAFNTVEEVTAKTGENLGDLNDKVKDPTFQDGLKKAALAFGTVKEQVQDLGTAIADTFSNSLAQFFDEVAAGTADASDAFKAFGRTVLSVLNEIIAKQIVLKFIKDGFGIDIDAKADGGIFPGGFQAFANGGIVNRPTLGLVGEGQFNEAVVPLPDGKRIPVDLRTPQGGGGDTFVVNVSAVDGASVERMLSTDSGRRAIQGAMRDARNVRRDLR